MLSFESFRDLLCSTVGSTPILSLNEAVFDTIRHAQITVCRILCTFTHTHIHSIVPAHPLTEFTRAIATPTAATHPLVSDPYTRCNSGLLAGEITQVIKSRPAGAMQCVSWVCVMIVYYEAVKRSTASLNRCWIMSHSSLLRLARVV